MPSNARDFQAQVSLKQLLCSSPLKQASYKQLTVIFFTGQAFSPQAARQDMPAGRFAEFLQTQAGKQQMAAGAGSAISLPVHRQAHQTDPQRTAAVCEAQLPSVERP